jgi:hypothetical protein
VIVDDENAHRQAWGDVKKTATLTEWRPTAKPNASRCAVPAAGRHP